MIGRYRRNYISREVVSWITITTVKNAIGTDRYESRGDYKISSSLGKKKNLFTGLDLNLRTIKRDSSAVDDCIDLCERRREKKAEYSPFTLFFSLEPHRSKHGLGVSPNNAKKEVERKIGK